MHCTISQLRTGLSCPQREPIADRPLAPFLPRLTPPLLLLCAKNWGGCGVSPSLRANTSAAIFPRMLVADARLLGPKQRSVFDPSNSCREKTRVFLHHFSQPSSPGVTQQGPSDAGMSSGLHYRRGTLILSNRLQANIPNLCPSGEILSLLYWTADKSALFLRREIPSLSSKAVCCNHPWECCLERGWLFLYQQAQKRGEPQSPAGACWYHLLNNLFAFRSSTPSQLLQETPKGRG